jgi:hypothetical protein
MASSSNVSKRRAHEQLERRNLRQLHQCFRRLELQALQDADDARVHGHGIAVKALVRADDVVGVEAGRQLVDRHLQIRGQLFGNEVMEQVRPALVLDRQQVPPDDGHNLPFFERKDQVLPDIGVRRNHRQVFELVSVSRGFERCQLCAIGRRLTECAF